MIINHLNSHINITTSLNGFHTEASNRYLANFQLADYQCALSMKNPLTFTGKELDSETGYSYFGARYYDAGLSGLFFSVDPMADKYLHLSPYNYCAWNPVVLTDYHGDTIKCVGDDAAQLNSYIQQFRNHFPNKYKKLQESTNNYIVQYTQSTNDKSGGYFTYNPETTYFEIFIANDRMSADNDYSDLEVLAHELRHAEQYEDGDIGFAVEYDRNNQCKPLSVKPIAYDIYDEIEAAQQANCFSYTPKRTTDIIANTRFGYSDLTKTRTSVKDYIESHGDLYDIYKPETYNNPLITIIHNVK